MSTEKMLENKKYIDLLTGYAGVTKNGLIVDRREVREAIPIQKDDTLNIPSPRPVLDKRISPDIAVFSNLTADEEDKAINDINKFAEQYFSNNISETN